MATSTARAARSSARGLWLSLRPHQWVKNTLVFSGLLFSRSLPHTDAVLISLSAFVAFCLASSGIYLINDMRDLEADQLHPVKRLRPLAAGLVSPQAAAILAGFLLAAAGVLGCLIRTTFVSVLCAYVLLNFLYSLGLKRVVILDVMIVAIGFLLRAVAGTAAIGVAASPWLVSCTLMLALFVGFGKRRHELHALDGDAGSHRAVLKSYTTTDLDLMMGISGAAAVVTYALYTVAPETVSRFGSQNLLLTIPFVLYGVFRFLHLVHRHDDTSDPAWVFVTDAPLLCSGLLWVLAVCLVIYTPFRGI